MAMGGADVEIVEVGMRDGFQSVGPFIPTATKIAILRDLYASGVRRLEATSFVSPAAVPQLADAADVLAAAQELAGVDAQVLVPTRRHADRAIAAGARHIAFVLSVSEHHNLGNVRRTPLQSADEYAEIATTLPSGTKLRLNIATAFDCPYEGPVAQEAVLDLLSRLVPAAPDAEIALCDTTGRAAPSQVDTLFRVAATRFPGVPRWAFHGHDTFGMGTANILSAWLAGVRVFDAAIAGLGGCPFAPGATGNVATEDVVWMFEKMGIGTGIDIDRLLEVASTVAALPGAQTGGRVRDAMRARVCGISGNEEG